MKDLTIILLTYNEEKNLPECLESIKSLGCHIFAVDSYSNDNTLTILEKSEITFVQHPFKDYASQRNWAQENNPFRTKWVFHLDAGERLSSELVDWLNNSFISASEMDGYMFSRRTMIFGKWVKHGGHYPNYHLRLFKAYKGYCEKKLYDQHFVVKGNSSVIKNKVDIIDTVLDNWYDFSRSHGRWAYFEAIDLLSKKNIKGDVEPKFWGNPMQRRRWLKQNIFQNSPLFLRAFVYFFYRYFIRLGFLDGKVGLSFHLLQGFWFRFLIDACVLELKLKMSTQSISLDDLIEKEYPQYVSIIR